MRRSLFPLAVLLLFSVSSFAQEIPDYDLGGARKPKPDFSFRKEGQYKRVHQAALRFILRDEIPKSEAFLTQYLKDHPDDEETLFMLGVLNVQRDNNDKGEKFLKQAVDAGLPAGRLIAGPRDLLKPLWDSPLLRNIRRQHATEPVQGPLVGSTTESSVSVWVRTADEVSVKLVVRELGKTGTLRGGADVSSRAVDDYTAVASINGLKPNTNYAYAVRIDNGPLRFHPGQTFRTFPADGKSSKFSLAFGGGAGFVPPNERMWDTIGTFNPSAMLLLGDNVYIDDPESVLMQQYTYQRRQSRPEWRKLTARTPTFTIWDDHDFSTNDTWGGADIAVPFWKKDWVFPIFRQNWANPAYGNGDAQPGCWYSFKMGDVDFIMLDCRYYRTDPAGTELSMLGPVQMAWLKQELTKATGTFVVVCSSVPWDFRTKGDSLDTWNGYKDERETIFGFIEEKRIEGVILLSADRHRSDAWKIDRENGYGLYEFSSSRLTNQHVHPRMEAAGAIFSYNELQSFGLVTIDTTAQDPTVKFDVVSIDGDKPFTLDVKRSQLVYEQTK
jgi:alkaline phosphatase D